MLLYAIKKQGKLQILSDELLETYLKTIKEDKKLKVQITQYRKPRTLRQNRYYWAIIHFIASELGYEKHEAEELHDTFKAMFNNEKKGRLRIVKSTTKLTTTEFVEYMETIIRWVAKELGISCPPPNYYGLTYIYE